MSRNLLALKYFQRHSKLSQKNGFLEVWNFEVTVENDGKLTMGQTRPNLFDNLPLVKVAVGIMVVTDSLIIIDGFSVRISSIAVHNST